MAEQICCIEEEEILDVSLLLSLEYISKRPKRAYNN